MRTLLVLALAAASSASFPLTVKITNVATKTEDKTVWLESPRGPNQVIRHIKTTACEGEGNLGQGAVEFILDCSKHPLLVGEYSARMSKKGIDVLVLTPKRKVFSYEVIDEKDKF